MYAQLTSKRIRLGVKKCIALDIGNQQDEYKHVQLFVYGWSVKSVQSNDYVGEKWEDTFNYDMKEISHLNSEMYVGQILSSDSKNLKNITKLRNKEIGIKDKTRRVRPR